MVLFAIIYRKQFKTGYGLIVVSKIGLIIEDLYQFVTFCKLKFKYRYEY